MKLFASVKCNKKYTKLSVDQENVICNIIAMSMGRCQLADDTVEEDIIWLIMRMIKTSPPKPHDNSYILFYW